MSVGVGVADAGGVTVPIVLADVLGDVVGRAVLLGAVVGVEGELPVDPDSGSTVGTIVDVARGTAVGVIINDVTCEGCSASAVVIGAGDGTFRHLAVKGALGLSINVTAIPISTARLQSTNAKMSSEREEDRMLNQSLY